MNIQNTTNVINDIVYLNPMFFHQINENPFILEDRKYPIDYGYLIERAFIINYTIPEGYEVIEYPEKIIVKLPNNDAYFAYNVTVMGNKISLTSRFNINKILFLPNEYTLLKEFYNQIIKKHAEPIVLKKI